MCKRGVCKTVLATHLSHSFEQKRWATVVLFVIVIIRCWCVNLEYFLDIFFSSRNNTSP